MNALETVGLTVKFGAFTAVKDLTIEVRRGEIFGFLGANGAGKTTAIRVLCGLLIPSSGKVRVAGVDLDGGADEIKKKVGYMSQKFTLYDDLTVLENLNFKASLRKIKKGEAETRIKRVFDITGFNYPVNTMVRDLPAGIRQQISLAATLIHDPEIIFLDEPTSGVSPAVRARFWSLIRTLSSEGKTLFVTTHYMDEAEQCGRIGLMRAGRLIACGSPAELEYSAYPRGIAELSFPPELKKDAALLLDSPAIAKFWPFGLKYHADIKGEAGLSSLFGLLPPSVRIKYIKPSLEDVFMKLVEGDDR